MEEFTKQEMKEHALKILSDMGVRPELVACYRDKDIAPQFILGRALSMECHISESLKKEVVWGTGEVYAITFDDTESIPMVNFLYLSPFPEDLKYMCLRADEGNIFRVYAYCYNVLAPELSEPGEIVVDTSNGCIKRIA